MVENNHVEEDAQVEESHVANENYEEVLHRNTIFAEPIFNIGDFTVTNSLINTWLVVIGFIVFAFALRSKLSTIPRGIQNAMEMVVDGALNLADSVTGSREKSLAFFPLTFILFIFILINNWTGLLPGVGSVGFIQVHDGQQVFVPLFRGGTADVNTTLALAICSIVLTHIFGVIFVGGWKYLNKFVKINDILEIPKKVRKDPSVLLVNPINFFVGIVEIIGEFAKVASLSFRLFGNVFAGEVLLASMAMLFAFLTPIPFMFLEIIVGIIQALIFSVLILVFLTINTSVEEH